MAPSVELVRGLQEGRFDFVLARVESETELQPLQAHPGRTEQVRMLVGADHPLAGRKVSLADTLAHEFVVQEPGSPIRKALEQVFLANSLPIPTKVTNSSSLLVALSMNSSSHVISPQTREVAESLARKNAGMAILDLEEDIVVPPFLVLLNDLRPLTPVAKRPLDEVLLRL